MEAAHTYGKIAVLKAFERVEPFLRTARTLCSVARQGRRWRAGKASTSTMGFKSAETSDRPTHRTVVSLWTPRWRDLTHINSRNHNVRHARRCTNESVPSTVI